MRGPLHSLIYGNKFSVQDIPSQTGKVIIVTGGNTGIGYESVKELARAGAKVYLAARSTEKAQAAIKEIKAELPDGQIEFLQLDLMDLAATKAAAESFSSKEAKLDVLMNNAGIMAVDYKLTKDRIEQQIQTNHVAPFLFTMLLLPKLQAASAPRIVNVSSIAHKAFFKAAGNSFASTEHLNDEKSGPWERYGQSKIANVLFSMKLAQSYPAIISTSCHPGNIDTTLYRGKPLLSLAMKASALVGAFLKPADGALTQLYLATAPDVENGAYYVPIALKAQTNSLATPEFSEACWKATESILHEKGYSW